MKKIINIIVLTFIITIPFCVYAEENSVEVQFSIPANVTFENENIVIREKIKCGEKLLEPSHIEIAGYIFEGWYNGDTKWDFDNDVVDNDITLVAKYIKEDNFSVNISSPKTSDNIIFWVDILIGSILILFKMIKRSQFV